MRSKKHFMIAIVALLVLLLVSVGISYAITHGELDEDGHPYVGLVLLYDEGGEYLWRCSGTLLSETVFLTAGHCTDGTHSAKVLFDTDLTELVYPYPDCGPYSCYEGDTYVHTNYDPAWSEFPNTYDVGIVVLGEAVDMDPYGEVAALGTLDGLDTRRGHNDLIVRTVGYGLQTGHPWWYSERVRYTSTSMIVELNSANTAGYGIHTSNNPGKAKGTGGACFGDSGGPIFYPEDSNTVVGVVSWGWSSTCTGADYAYRTDILDAQDFILPFLEQ